MAGYHYPSTLALCPVWCGSLQQCLTQKKEQLGAMFTSSSTDPFTSGEFIYNSLYNSLCLEEPMALLTDGCLQNIALPLTIPKCAVVVFTDLCLRKI